MRRLRARLVNKAPLRAPDVDKLLKLLGIWDLGVGRSKFDRRKWTGLGDDANEFLVLGLSRTQKWKLVCVGAVAR